MENGFDVGMIIFSILVLFVFIWLWQRIFRKMKQPNPLLWAIGIFIPFDRATHFKPEGDGFIFLRAYHYLRKIGRESRKKTQKVINL